MAKKIKVGILGASGYTGLECLRLLEAHPHVEMGPLGAHKRAGKQVADIFPQLRKLGPYRFIELESLEWKDCDLLISCLPHAKAQDLLFDKIGSIKIIDLSADYRFRDPEIYEKHYDRIHIDKENSAKAVYGLCEIYGAEIAEADLVACPGCYPTATLLPLIPLLREGLVAPDPIVIDAKSGVSGAGRSLKTQNLFCEVAESLSPYAVAQHRHAPEIDQELSLAAGAPIRVSFTPHLVPMNRGELITSYVGLKDHADLTMAREALSSSYEKHEFVHLLDGSDIPNTKMTRGSNDCVINLFEDRVPGRLILISVIDNLVKGSAGQAVQNMNLMFGFEPETGLRQLPLFP